MRDDRLYIHHVLIAVDDPELFIARREVQDLLVVGENDERREAELGPYRDNVLARVADHPRAFAGSSGNCPARREQRQAGN